VKKDVKSKVAAKKWLDGRLMAKILIMAIQVPNPSEMRRRQHKFTSIVAIKIFAISLYHQAISWPPCTLDFTSFFTMAFLGATHFFTAGLF